MTINSEEEAEIVDLYNDIVICRTFGRTLPQLHALPLKTYQDIIHIISKENAIKNAEAKSKQSVSSHSSRR